MQPALGLLELASIAAGIRAGDAMVKRAPVDVIWAGTVHPGKFLVLVAGAVASVEEALIAGREGSVAALVDEVFLPDVDPKVVAALKSGASGGEPRPGGALGVVETRTVAAILGAADRGVKGADVELRRLRIADDLGGKAYCLFAGAVADVEAAVEAAVAGVTRPDHLLAQVVIPLLHDEMLANLDAAAEFLPRLRG